ncbi:uncharacterized protein ACNS7B_018072 isoform 2-T6 [Menidia menidia]
MYYFQYQSKTYCVDATKETGRLGRLINHSKNGNCQTRLHPIDGAPHLILVASRDIEAEEELLYDYGSNTDGDSDNEPLVKMAKVSSKAARKPRSAAPRKSASRKKRASPQKDDSSDDDEPLSQIAKKVRDQYPRRRAAMASKKPPPGRQIPADGGQEKREIRGDVQRPQLRGRAAGRGQEEEELRGAQRAEELPCQAGSQQPSRQQLRGGRGPAGGPGEEKTSEEEHKEEPQGQGVGAEERTLRAELRGRAAPRATGGQDHPPQLRLPGEQLATC